MAVQSTQHDIDFDLNYVSAPPNRSQQLQDVDTRATGRHLWLVVSYGNNINTPNGTGNNREKQGTTGTKGASGTNGTNGTNGTTGKGRRQGGQGHQGYQGDQ